MAMVRDRLHDGGVACVRESGLIGMPLLMDETGCRSSRGRGSSADSSGGHARRCAPSGPRR
jgi:hypothetical protein